LPVAAGPTLDAIRARGQRVCGIHTGLAGCSGDIDVLFHTSTRTMLRDTTLGLRHASSIRSGLATWCVRSAIAASSTTGISGRGRR
jgi:general L-amino acid transport system substrate-binding protein